MRQMKAAVWDGGAQVRLVQKEVPVIEHPHEAIVKVSMAAICSSDLHILHGAVPEAKRGVTLGHEMVGTIVQCGSAVKRFAPGERVSVNVETSCGSCFYCRNGFVNNCSDPLGGWSLGRRIDGGQAEYVRVPYAEQGLIANQKRQIRRMQDEMVGLLGQRAIDEMQEQIEEKEAFIAQLEAELEDIDKTLAEEN